MNVNHPSIIKINTITYAVAYVFAVPHGDLVSKLKSNEIVAAQHAAFYIARKHLDVSLSTIAHVIGNRTHCTVTNGCERADKRMRLNPDYRDMVARAENLFLNWGKNPSFDSRIRLIATQGPDAEPVPQPKTIAVQSQARDNIDCPEDREMRAMISKGSSAFGARLQRENAA